MSGGMHVVESYGVATVRNDITAPRRLATLSVGSMGKTPRLGSKIRAIDSYRSYGRPMRASSPLKNTRLSRGKKDRGPILLATTTLLFISNVFIIEHWLLRFENFFFLKL